MFVKTAPWIFRIGVGLGSALLTTGVAHVAGAQPPDASQYASARAVALQIEADAKAMLAAAESQRASDPRFDDRVIDSYRAFASTAERFRETLSDDDYRRLQGAYGRVVALFPMLPETRLADTTRDRLASSVSNLDKYYLPTGAGAPASDQPMIGERGTVIRLSRQLEQETRQLASTANLEARKGDRTDRRMVTLFESMATGADRFNDTLRDYDRAKAQQEFRELAGLFNRVERRYPSMHPSPTVEGALKRVSQTMTLIGTELRVGREELSMGSTRGTATPRAVMAAVRSLAEEIHREARQAFETARIETERAPARRYTREYRVNRYRPDPRKNALPDLAALASAAENLDRAASSGRGSSSREFEMLQRAQQRVAASSDYFSTPVKDALDDVRDAVNELSTYYYAQEGEYAERLW